MVFTPPARPPVQYLEDPVVYAAYWRIVWTKRALAALLAFCVSYGGYRIYRHHYLSARPDSTPLTQDRNSPASKRDTR